MSDRWSSNGLKFDEDAIAKIAVIAEDVSPVILEHWHYRGGTAPTRLIFSDQDGLVEYLRSHARPGDSIWTWRYDELCRENNFLAHGKVPNAQGEIPEGGAY